jgi:hypothetical protein
VGAQEEEKTTTKFLITGLGRVEERKYKVGLRYPQNHTFKDSKTFLLFLLYGTLIKTF